MSSNIWEVYEDTAIVKGHNSSQEGFIDFGISDAHRMYYLHGNTTSQHVESMQMCNNNYYFNINNMSCTYCGDGYFSLWPQDYGCISCADLSQSGAVNGEVAAGRATCQNVTISATATAHAPLSGWTYTVQPATPPQLANTGN